MVRTRTISYAVAAWVASAGVACTAPHTTAASHEPAASPRAALAVPADPVPFEGTFPTAEGRHRATLTVAGLAREVDLVVPAQRAAGAPLLVLLHGTRGDGAGIIDECGALGLAHTEGVVIAAPVAREMPSADWDHPEQSNERWWQTEGDHDPARDADLLLVRATIAAARRDYAIDPSRVYVMGHSNGAFFALVVMNTLGDRLAGVAFNSGGLVRCAHTGSCEFRAGRVADCAQFPSMAGWCDCGGPALPMDVTWRGRRFPVVISHGTDDPDVSVQYACALDASLRSAGFPVTLQLRPGDGHFCDSDFVERSWRALHGRRHASL